MSISLNSGYIFDALQHCFVGPSKQTISAWPSGIFLLKTKSGKVRVLDTGGDKSVIVMVPDGPCVIEHFYELVSKLVCKYRVVCFEMPGLGFSYPKFRFDFGLEKSGEVVLAVMDSLGIGRATLNFSCVNGYVALALAKTHPERVSSLVISQTSSLDEMKNHWIPRNIPTPLKTPVLGQWLSVVKAKEMTKQWYASSLPKNSELKQGFEEVSLSALHDGGCFCLASIIQGVEGFEESKINNAKVPTTLIWGGSDSSHQGTDFYQFRKHAPNSKVIQWEGCGHFPYLEQPTKFANLLGELLEAVKK